MSTMLNQDAYIFFSNTTTGETGDPELINWLGVEQFNLTIGNAYHQDTATGFGAGIAYVHHLHVHIIFDRALITLRRHLILGTHFTNVNLTVRREGGDKTFSQQQWYKLEMKNALIVHSDLTFAGSSQFYCAIELLFREHKECYSPQDFEGNPTGDVSYGWDSFTHQVL